MAEDEAPDPGHAADSSAHDADSPSARGLFGSPGLSGAGSRPGSADHSGPADHSGSADLPGSADHTDPTDHSGSADLPGSAGHSPSADHPAPEDISAPEGGSGSSDSSPSAEGARTPGPSAPAESAAGIAAAFGAARPADPGRSVSFTGELPAVPQARRGRRGLRIAGRALVGLLSAGVLLVTGAGWAALGGLDRDVSSSRVLTDPPVPPPPADDGATDVLLIGNDSRTDAQGRPLPLRVLKALRTESTNGLNTDTLILLRIPHNGGQPTAVSLPRDTSVPVPSGGTQKINAVYGLAKRAAEDSASGGAAAVERESQLAGQQALVQSVQQLSGVRVDRYAEVNLLGFYEVTEALGGVEVCLRHATSDKDSGADFAAGPQTVSGGDALSFVRQRHGLPGGDLDRIVRQQVFMAALVHKLLSTGTLADPAKIAHLQEAARSSVVLDENWDLPGFAAQMQGLADGSVRFETLPVLSTAGRDEHGQSVVTVDPEQVRAFFRALVPPTGFAARGPLVLDGTAHRRQPPGPTAPITTDGIPCVN